jgi:putative DNA primase/helicase
MEITVFSKDYGILTKEIRVESGALEKDATHCRMAQGRAELVTADSLAEARPIIEGLQPHQAMSLGTTSLFQITKRVRIVKKGQESATTASRTKAYFDWPDGEGLMLLDYDPKDGELAWTVDQLRDHTLSLIPELHDCEMLIMSSTSAGCYLDGEDPPMEIRGGAHILVRVKQAKRIPEIGKLIDDRSWLKGYGWVKIGKKWGARLLRALFDAAVHSPERLIFRARPVLGPGVSQLPPETRYYPGEALDFDKINPVSEAELAAIEKLKESALSEARPRAEKVRDSTEREEVARLVKSGHTEAAARKVIEKRRVHTLTGGASLRTTEGMLTAADLLRDPPRYTGVEMTDPDESDDEHARIRAMFFNNEDGKCVIWSFDDGGKAFIVDKTEIVMELDNLNRMFRKVEAALSVGGYPDIFTRGDMIVHVGRDGIVRPVSSSTAPLLVGRLIRFIKPVPVKKKKSEDKANESENPCEPQMQPCELRSGDWDGWLELGGWALPKLNGVVENPFFYDGEIVQKRGYHSKTQLFLTQNFEIKIPQVVTRQDAEEALSRLRGILAGFPFVTPTDESVAIAKFLTAVQRQTLPTAPAFGSSAHTAGTGKTKLAAGACSLMTGKTAIPKAYTNNQTELAKVLFSELLCGSQYILLDNAGDGVGVESDMLCSMLTAAEYRDRVLGKSWTKQVPTRALVIFTGNNLTIKGDLTRRTLMIHMDAKCERPELRNFEQDFTSLIEEQRLNILRDSLIILKGYHDAGSPKVEYTRLGSFESWSDAISAPMVWLGLPDPALGLAKLSHDELVMRLGEFLELWFTCFRYTALTVQQALENPAIRAFFQEEFDDKIGLNPKRCGRWMARYEGRIVDGHRLVRASVFRGTVKWQLERVARELSEGFENGKPSRYEALEIAG